MTQITLQTTILRHPRFSSQCGVGQGEMKFNPDKDMLNVKGVTRCSTYAGIFLLLAHEIHERGEKVRWIRVFWLEQIFEDFLVYD